MFKHSLVAFALIAAVNGAAVGAPPSAPPVRHFVLGNTQIIPIHSKFTGRDHELVVVLPDSYAANPDKTYPVLYFLDAYWDTPLMVSTYGNLVYDKQVPEFIMVGLSYPSTANYGAERLIDYTFSGPAPTSGKGAAFLEFIKREVAPLIETTYRGAKTDRVISGNSLGGLFAIATAYKAPGFFAGHIAVSPAVDWDNGALAKYDQAYAEHNKRLDARMFVSYGTAENAAFRGPIIQFQQHLAARKYQDFGLQNYAMEGLEHVSVKGDGYVRGLMWVWKPKKPAAP